MLIVAIFAMAYGELRQITRDEIRWYLNEEK